MTHRYRRFEDYFGTEVSFLLEHPMDDSKLIFTGFLTVADS